MPEGLADDSLCLQAMQLDMHQSVGMRQAEHWRSVMRIPRTRPFSNTFSGKSQNKSTSAYESKVVKPSRSQGSVAADADGSAYGSGALLQSHRTATCKHTRKAKIGSI